MARNVPNLPVLEAMKLWGELVECLYGFGGSVAEVYAYRLHGHSPAVANLGQGQGQGRSSSMLSELVRDAESEAGANLHAVLTAFAEHYKAEVVVEGMPLEMWGIRPFSHRVHVAVTRHG